MTENQTNEKLKLLEAYRAAFWPEARSSYVLLTLADSYCALSQFDEAARLLGLAIESDPKNAVAHYRLAEVYEERDRFADAIEKFADAAYFDSEDKLEGHSAVRQLADGPLEGGRAVSALRKVAEKYPEDLEFKEALADACRNGGELFEAERLYRELLAQDFPNDEWKADLELRLSWVLSIRGDHAGAAVLMERALPRLGSQWDLYDLEDSLAEEYLEAGGFESALQIYLDRLSLLSPSAGLGIHNVQDEFSKVRNPYDKLLRRLLDIAIAVEKKVLDDSEGSSSKAQANDPRFLGRLYLALSRCCKETGCPEDAEQDFKKAMSHFARFRGDSGEPV